MTGYGKTNRDQPTAAVARCSKFWGRTKELEILSQYINNFVQNNSPLLVVVAGETGVGKTALVEHFFQTNNFNELFVLKTCCYQIEKPNTFKIFGQVLRQLAELLYSQRVKLPALWVHTMLAIFPSLADDPLFDDMDQGNFSMGNCAFAREVIISILKKAANGRKTVIFVDDFHWADSDSQLLLKELILKYGEQFMVISTCRNEYLQELEPDCFLWKGMGTSEL